LFGGLEAISEQNRFCFDDRKRFSGKTDFVGMVGSNFWAKQILFGGLEAKNTPFFISVKQN
jgi:hypothetical protein